MPAVDGWKPVNHTPTYFVHGNRLGYVHEEQPNLFEGYALTSHTGKWFDTLEDAKTWVAETVAADYRNRRR